MAAALRLVEVFESAQGEGIYLGARQTFVRLAGCNLSCPYCDTPAARAAQVLDAEFPAGQYRGRRRNPVAVSELTGELESMAARTRLHSVSWTGGEPLMQAEALQEAMGLARAAGLRNYLQTNGTLPGAMRRVAGLCDFVAMDIKLPSASGLAWNGDAVLEFIRAAEMSGLFVKAVVTSLTGGDEIALAARTVARASRAIPFVIQPVTPVPQAPAIEPPSAEALLDLQAAALDALNDVRIIAQMHGRLGLR